MKFLIYAHKRDDDLTDSQTKAQEGGNYGGRGGKPIILKWMPLFLCLL